jgi:hypothetical protein
MNEQKSAPRSQLQLRAPSCSRAQKASRTARSRLVVPGSGTGDLTALRGEGGFEGRFGEASDGTLDYWFE